MKQMKLYTTFLTEKGDIVCVIPTEDANPPSQPKILYAGGEHALFYRTPDQAFILDYINEVVQTVLKQTSKLLMFEIDLKQQDILTDYFVPIIMAERLPSFELEQISRD